MHHAKLAENALQVLQEVLEAMTEAVQKQQTIRDEVQQQIDDETSESGCRKQHLKKRLAEEDEKLQLKRDNLKEAQRQALRDSWHGEHLDMEDADHVMHLARGGAQLQEEVCMAAA